MKKSSIKNHLKTFKHKSNVNDEYKDNNIDDVFQYKLAKGTVTCTCG